MNKVIIFVVFFIIFVPLSAFGQYREFEDSINSEKLYMFVQIEVRDSNGNLSAYIETDRIVITDFEKLSDDLDKMPDKNKKTITINGEDLEITTGVGVATHQTDTVVSLSAISGESGIVAYANHDGYPVKSGDEAKSIWTIVRPVA